MVPTVVSLGLEMENIFEGPQRPEVSADIMDGAFFHLAFFKRAGDIRGYFDGSERQGGVQ
jgi:hypothetical protein